MDAPDRQPLPRVLPPVRARPEIRTHRRRIRRVSDGVGLGRLPAALPAVDGLELLELELLELLEVP
jgi:hypothetical protein